MDIHTKFNVGDELYTYSNNLLSIISFKVKEIRIFINDSMKKAYVNYYNEDSKSRTKDELFRTKGEAKSYMIDTIKKL